MLVVLVSNKSQNHHPINLSSGQIEGKIPFVSLVRERSDVVKEKLETIALLKLKPEF